MAKSTYFHQVPYIYLTQICKEKETMSTCNQLDLETLYPKKTSDIGLSI